MAKKYGFIVIACLVVFPRSAGSEEVEITLAKLPSEASIAIQESYIDLGVTGIARPDSGAFLGVFPPTNSGVVRNGQPFSGIWTKITAQRVFYSCF